MSLRFDDFELLGKLDDDGLWETWLARAVTRERGAPPLAYMRRIPSGRASMKELLLLHRQVARAAALRSRDLIPILSHGKSGDDYMVLIAAFPGQTVGATHHRHLKQTGDLLPIEFSVEILARVADALASAHTALGEDGGVSPVVHGTLSSGTTLIDHRGGVRVTDVGLALCARAPQAESLRENEWRYVSPEAFRGARDARSDVFSWGVIAWELITGEPLYGPDVPASARMRTIAGASQRSLARSNNQVSRALDQIVGRALQGDPGNRFADGAQLASVVDQHVKPDYGEVTAAHMTGLMDRLFADVNPLWPEALRATVEADAERAVELFRELAYPDIGPQTAYGVGARLHVPYSEPISGASVTVDETIPDNVAHPSVQLDAQGLFDDIDLDLDFDLGSEPVVDGTEDIRATTRKGLGSVNAFDDDFQLPPPAPSAPVDIPSDLQNYSLEEIDQSWDAVQHYSQPRASEAATFEQHAQPQYQPAHEQQPQPQQQQQYQQPEPAPQPTPAAAPAEEPRTAPTPARREPVDRQSFKIKTHAGYQIDDDDDDDEGPFVEPFPIEQVVTHPSSPDAGGKRRVVEVIKIVGAVAADNALLQGFNRTYRDRDLTVAMSLEKSTVTYEKVASGTIRLIDGSVEAIPPPPGRFRLQFGEQATIHKGGATYLIRSFRPPDTPAAVRRRDPKEVIRPFIGASVISLVAHVLGFALVMFTESLGVTLTIERSETVEVFAEGRLEKPKEKPKPPKKKPKPPPKPKPKKPTRPTEKKADPTEQKPQVPKSVRKKLDRRLKQRPARETNEEARADQLVAALTTKVAGDGETVADTVTNIDAVKTPGQPSALRVAGTIAALEGNEVNVGRGGGGKLGDLTKGVKDGAGKLEKRKGDKKVRGKVNASKALSKVQGSLSKAEVYAVISKHQQQILRCYEKRLAQKPGLAGKVSFEWTVKTNGSVRNVREQSSTLNDATVSKCVIGVIKTMKFPRPKGGEVIIVYPFFFQTK